MPKTEKAFRLPSSYRDPSGFLFRRNGKLLRQVNLFYRSDYDHCQRSGLYETLMQQGKLVPHHESRGPLLDPHLGYIVLAPEEVRFISYPYEWCFSQLKDAALVTLDILRTALQHGMVLKDATPFNIQFHRGRPILIDSLSFQIYRQGEPWIAYRQFCEQFLAPIALAAFTHERLGLLQQSLVEGIPLALASRLLPLRAKIKPGLFAHIVLHARTQTRFQDVIRPMPKRSFSQTSFLGLIDSLERTVRSLSWELPGSPWLMYDETKLYSKSAATEKESFVAESVKRFQPRIVWDLGANVGLFSQIAASRGAYAVALDSDAAVIERLYRRCRSEKQQNILPLVMDVAAPSPSIGWRLNERMSLIDRGPADLVLALALVHHLAIGRNIPLEKIAEFLSDVARNLVIEFVPKDDPQVSRLLGVREDIFASYSLGEFERAFGSTFRIRHRSGITGTGRVLYSMQNRRSL